MKPLSKGPLLATTSLFALGISEIIIYLLMGRTVPGMPFALVYMLAGVPLIAYLWKKGSLDKPVALLALVLSTTAGFVFLSPIMPMEFIGLVLLASGSGVLVPAIIGILVVLAMSLLVGRVFCGHICPVGAVQELASFIPLKKTDIRDTRIPEIIRFTVFIAVVAGGVYLIDLMKYTGAYDFFSLALTAGFFIFAALLLLSVFLYRPVCRFLCPYGYLLAPVLFQQVPAEPDICMYKLQEMREGLPGSRGRGWCFQAGVLPLRALHRNLPGRGSYQV